MEESEKRRERLKAMRMEATRDGVHSDDGYTMVASYSLTNPLVEASVTPSAHAEPNVAPRFDYYTDPMSAFSANKSRSKGSHQLSPDYFTPPRPRISDITPAYQAQSTYALDQISQHTGSYCSSGPFGSPMGSPCTFGTPQEGNMNVACGTYGLPSNLSRGGNFPRPDFVQRGSLSAKYVEHRGCGINNSPQTGSGNWGRPFPHSGRGRTQSLGSYSPQTGSGDRGSPRHHSGRGRSHWHGYNNPGLMRSGRGIGPCDNMSAELRPDLYYDKSMVEDPWEMLKLVIWRRGGPTSLDTPDSSKPWLPKSISSKKARVSEASIKYTAGKSLAEDLAVSFHAVASHEPRDDSAKDNF